MSNRSISGTGKCRKRSVQDVTSNGAQSSRSPWTISGAADFCLAAVKIARQSPDQSSFRWVDQRMGFGFASAFPSCGHVARHALGSNGP